MPFEKIGALAKIEKINYGSSKEEIKLMEKELGFSIPNGLKKFYQEFGNHKSKIPIFEDFYPLEKLEIDKDGYLVFFRDSHTGVKWGIKAEDLKIEKSNVYHNKAYWQLDNDDILQTIIALGFDSALFKLPFFELRITGIEELEEQKVYKNFKKNKEELSIWETKFYQSTPNDLIRLTKSDNEVHLAIAANNEEEINRIKSIFKDDWYSRENQLKKMKARNKKE